MGFCHSTCRFDCMRVCFDREYEFGLLWWESGWKLHDFSYVGFPYYRCISATSRKESSNFSTSLEPTLSVRFFRLQVTEGAVLMRKTDRRNAISIYIAVANSFTPEHAFFVTKLPFPDAKFLPNCDRAPSGISPSWIRVFATKIISRFSWPNCTFECQIPFHPRISQDRVLSGIVAFSIQACMSNSRKSSPRQLQAPKHLMWGRVSPIELYASHSSAILDLRVRCHPNPSCLQ